MLSARLTPLNVQTLTPFSTAGLGFATAAWAPAASKTIMLASAASTTTLDRLNIAISGRLP